MQRVMTQYGIATDFEVWSTFVMQHDKSIGTAYKLHEVIGQHAASIKETYKRKCHSAAGGRNFDSLAPFVAAMYYVTYEEVQDCMRSQCITSSKEARISGVMITFPWLFAAELGQIANDGVVRNVQTHADPVGPVLAEPHFSKQTPPKESRRLVSHSPEQDILQTGHGEMHLGDELILFGDSKDSVPDNETSTDVRRSSTQAEYKEGNTTKRPETPIPINWGDDHLIDLDPNSPLRDLHPNVHISACALSEVSELTSASDGKAKSVDCVLASGRETPEVAGPQVDVELAPEVTSKRSVLDELQDLLG